MQKYKIALNLLTLLTYEPKDINASWDRLFTYIHANFAKPNYGDAEAYKQELADVYDMLVTDKFAMLDKLKAMPPEYSEVTFVVAVTRFITCRPSVRLDPVKMTTFDEHFARYGKILVDSMFKPKSLTF